MSNPFPSATDLTSEERARMTAADLVIEHLADYDVCTRPLIAHDIVSEFSAGQERTRNDSDWPLRWHYVIDGPDMLLRLVAWLLEPGDHDAPDVAAWFEDLTPIELGVALSALTIAGRGNDAETTEHRLLRRLFDDQDHGPMLNIGFARSVCVVEHGPSDTCHVAPHAECGLLSQIRDTRLLGRMG